MNTRIIFVLIIIIKRISLLQIRYSVKDGTSQGKTIAEKYSYLAIDGDIDSCAISESKENELAWWSVKLDKDYNVERIIINYNPGAEHLHKYISHFIVYVSKNTSNLEENICASFTGKKDDVPRLIILNCAKRVYGNLVTIKRFGGLFRNLLVLCEVLILADLEIVSFNKPTFHNGIMFKNTSELAVDGNNDSCAKIIAHKGRFAWWQIALDEDYYIDKIQIYFKQNSSEASTLNYFNVYVSNAYNNFEKHICESFNTTTDNLNGVIELKCKEPKPRGKFVTIKKFGGTFPHHLHGLCEIDIYSKNYNTSSECNSTHRECLPLQMCLPEHNLCDGVKNCPDGLDESMSSCKCQSFQYMCEWNYHCIPLDWLCDGFKDCPNGDDEKTGCECPEDGMFKCVTRQKCIKKVDHCNGVTDCPDNSDEKNCFFMRLDYLKVIHKGNRDDYRLCSTHWDDIDHGTAMCDHLSSDTAPLQYHNSYFAVTYNKDLKYIALKSRDRFINNIPKTSDFIESKTCDDDSYVQLSCKPPKRYSRPMCGMREYNDTVLTPYIINGVAAKDGAWPWHVQLFKNGIYSCGGSLINNNWIVTAKECIGQIYDGKELTATVGALSINDPMIPKLRISRIIDNLLMDEKMYYLNDIALIRLEKPVVFTSNIKPICIPHGLNDRYMLRYSGYCIFAGFGNIDRDHTTPTSLMQGRMNIMSEEECTETLANLSMTERHVGMKANRRICAGSPPTEIGINPCWGDNGGPLMCKERNGQWNLIGVMIGESKECKYSVFAHVIDYADSLVRVMHREDGRNIGSNKSTT